VKAAVVSLRQYQKSVTRLLTAAERIALEDSIAADPEAHPVIPGAGGVRAIYYYLASGGTVYMLAVYAKAHKEDLTERDKREPRNIATALKGGRIQ
jgi:hypothetical protein